MQTMGTMGTSAGFLVGLVENGNFRGAYYKTMRKFRKMPVVPQQSGMAVLECVVSYNAVLPAAGVPSPTVVEKVFPKRSAEVSIKIGKQRRVVLKQLGGGERSGKNTVDVQVKEGDVSSRRSIDLQLEGGTRIRSRANTLELKLNGEVMKKSTSEDSRQSSPRGSKTLSVIRHDSTNGSLANLPNSENRQNLTIDNSQAWSAFNPKRQFYVLKAFFILLCFVDIMHWAYLLRDDTVENPNSWRFYKKFQSFDVYYLVARMFGDIFTCVLGLGAAMWTRKPILTLPCTMIQLLFLLIRAVVWTVRGYNRALLRVESTSEDKIFVACEFILPAVWAILSVLIVHTMKQLRSYEQLHGYAHPPVIVLTVKNDDNDESVQIEIA